jgi:uncharacterized protein
MKGFVIIENYILGLPHHLLPIFCIFLAAFLQSITGFGLVIVAAPLLLLFYDVKTMVPIMLLLACCGNFIQGLMYIKNANRSLVAWLYLGVLLGQPFGFWVFDYMDSSTLKLLINLLILLSLILMQASHRKIAERPRNSFITGIFSGFTSITTGMGGPPFLIYLAYTEMTTKMFRATCFVFFFLCNATSLTSYLIGGFSLVPALGEFIYLLPALVIGIIAGHVLYQYIPKQFIHRLIFLLLYLTAISAIASTLYHKLIA